MSTMRQWPAPWLFFLLMLPSGITVGSNATPLPFLLAKTGVPVDRIATVSSILSLGGVLVFVWAPLADVKLRRRTWLGLGIFGTALVACAFFPLIGPSHLTLLTMLGLLGGVPFALMGAACGGLMVRTLSPVAQAKASAWWQAGFLGGGALSGAAVMWLATRLPLLAVGFCTAALIALPIFLPFSIPEPKPAPSSWFRGRLRRIGKEIWDVIRTPERRWSAALLIAPGGTGAAMFLLPAIASHYGVGAKGVTWINGISGGTLMALGSLSGTLIPADWDRRFMYAVAGVLNALATIVLLLGSHPSFYLVGTTLYLITNGFCYTWFTALVAEIVGPESGNTSTLFSVLTSAGSLAPAYMIWLDGVGYRHFGIHGLLWTDAGASLLVCAVVFTVFVTCGLGLRRVPTPQISTRGAFTS